MEITLEYLKSQDKSIIDTENFIRSTTRFADDKKQSMKSYEALEEYVKFKSGLYKIPKEYQKRTWELAWEYGHSSGYSEVSHYLEELISIFKTK